MTLREKIEVMEAFERGEEIEVSYYGYEEWRTVNNPSWSWNVNKYRIKPKPKQVVVIEKWLISTSNGYIVRELSETAVNMLYEAKEKRKLLDTYEVEL